MRRGTIISVPQTQGVEQARILLPKHTSIVSYERPIRVECRESVMLDGDQPTYRCKECHCLDLRLMIYVFQSSILLGPLGEGIQNQSISPHTLVNLSK